MSSQLVRSINIHNLMLTNPIAFGRARAGITFYPHCNFYEYFSVSNCQFTAVASTTNETCLLLAGKLEK